MMFTKTTTAVIVLAAVFVTFVLTRYVYSIDHSHDHPVLFVGSGFDDYTHKYLELTGSGWFASETLDILAIGVPQRNENGTYSSSTAWTKIGVLTTNGSGMFPSPKVHIPVTPFCGVPPPGLQNPTFKAQDPKLAMSATSPGDTQAWFTFQQQCP